MPIVPSVPAILWLIFTPASPNKRNMKNGIANISTGIVISISLLVFHFGCVGDIDILAHPEQIDYDGYGERGLCGGNGYAEEREHPAVIGAGEQITVKDDKVNIDSVEH